MVGYEMNKYGESHGMRKGGGMLYGWLHGYMVSMDEGAGYKDVLVSAHMKKGAAEKFLAAAQGGALADEYNIMQAEYEDGRLAVRFRNKRGSMDLIARFIDEQLPSLPANGLSCPVCGRDVERGSCRLVLYDNMVQPVHTHCRDELSAQLNGQAREQRRTHSAAPRNYGRGILGAIAGAFVGAVPWAVTLGFSNFYPVLGLLVGICSKFGYEIMKGRRGVVKAVSVLLCTLVAAFTAQLVGTIIIMAVSLSGEPLSGMGVIDAPLLTLQILGTDAEMMASFRDNLLQGGLFALLGCVGLVFDLRSAKNAESAEYTYKDVT